MAPGKRFVSLEYFLFADTYDARSLLPCTAIVQFDRQGNLPPNHKRLCQIMYQSTHVGRWLRGFRGLVPRGSLLLAGFLLTAVSATPVSGPHGSVEVVAEPASIEPGRAFWVGLHFQLEKGWHIYWTNPGDSGEPPKVQWSLPAGFRASPLNWPIPRRIQDHSLIDYGYQDEVLLPVEIQPPAGLGAGHDVQLGASVKWLVCREVCIPGHATLTLTLPVKKAAPGQPSSWHPLFIRTRADLPKPAPQAWKPAARLEGQRFLLNVETGKQETAAVFFPFEPNQVENAAPQNVNSSSRGLLLELQKSDLLLKPPPYLAGVLVVASGAGYVIQAPVVMPDSKRTH
jgi:thiol:disulfide interchange protein DsbD